MNLNARPNASRIANRGDDLLPSEQFCSVYDRGKDHYRDSNKLDPLDLLFGDDNHHDCARRGRHSDVVPIFRDEGRARCGDAGGTLFDRGPVF